MLPRLALLVLCCSALVSAGELKLISLFSDHAVLQAGDAAVFGKAHPGSKVSVKLGSTEATATAGNDGKWTTTLRGLLLFVRGEWDREARVGAAFRGRSFGADVRARGVFGCEAEGR